MPRPNVRDEATPDVDSLSELEQVLGESGLGAVASVLRSLNEQVKTLHANYASLTEDTFKSRTIDQDTHVDEGMKLSALRSTINAEVAQGNALLLSVGTLGSQLAQIAAGQAANCRKQINNEPPADQYES